MENLKKKYNFSSNFFFLPNQYWAHKNHIVVLKALNYLRQKNKNNNILILSTGSNDDQKGFQNYERLKEFIAINKLKSNYKYLGIVPYHELMSLMYHSIAVINPSKFEGRSSTVEQAKSIGKNNFVKNKIHYEQNPKRGLFFYPDDNIKLAEILFNENKKFNKSKEKKFIKIPT